MDKCLVIVNRPVHIMFFYNLWSKHLLPPSKEIGFLVNKLYSDHVRKFGIIFSFPIGKIYTFEEPLSVSSYSNVLSRTRDFVKCSLKYSRIIKSIRAVPLSDYGYILTFADDMLHFQYLIYLYKKNKDRGLVYLADEGTGLYYHIKRRSFIREVLKKLIFLHYRTVSMGCNPLTDITLARFPEKCNCAKQVKKIDYRIPNQEDTGKWCKVFGVHENTFIDLRKISTNVILFLGTPFEGWGVSYDAIIEFLCKVREFETSDIVVKPHPKEDSSLYARYFDVLPASLPAEILLGEIRFKFVLGYYSSALIEASLYGQQTCYFNLPMGEEDAIDKNILDIFEGLNITRYPLRVTALKQTSTLCRKSEGASQ